jgi:hypothetical protein
MFQWKSYAFLLAGITFSFILFHANAADAATYYVAKTGSDSNSCAAAQNQATPKVTINGGLACIKGGDTLLIGNGTYVELVDTGQGSNIPSGTSAARTTIKAKDGLGGVIIKPTAANPAVYLAGRQWVLMQDLIVDSINQGTNHVHTIWVDTTSTDIEFLRVEAKNAGAAGFYLAPTTARISLRYVWSHNNGRNTGTTLTGNCALGVYFQAQNSLIEYSVFEDNGVPGWCNAGINGSQTGGGIPSIIRYNIIRDNLQYGIVARNSLFNVHNNLIYNNSHNSAGVATVNLNSGSTLRNNTIVSNGSLCVNSGSDVRNNICWGNDNNSITTAGTVSNNLFTDPKFVNAAANDYHLQSTSPAINAGMTLSETTPDFDGVTRPQGSAYDIGAYEFVSGGSTTGGTTTGGTTTGGTTGGTPPSTNPIAHWKFDEGLGFSTTDSSGNGNIGTLTNGPTWTSGQLRGAVSLDGSDDLVTVPDSTSLDITNTLTISLWAKQSGPLPTGQLSAFVSKRTQSGPGSGYGFSARNAFGGGNANRLTFTWYGVVDVQSTADVFPNDTNWHLYSVTHDGSNVKFYVDGILKDTVANTASGVAGANMLAIGRYNADQTVLTNERLWNGALDDVRIYNRALSATEVQSLYTTGGTTPSCEANAFTTSSALPTSFASPFDLVSNPNQSLMNVSCTTSGASLNLGNGSSNLYIYKHAHVWKGVGNGWEQVDLTGSNLVGGNWYVGNASASSLPLMDGELTAGSYVVSYQCTWIPQSGGATAGQAGQWKCGCKTAECNPNITPKTGGMWQLQRVKK